MARLCASAGGLRNLFLDHVSAWADPCDGPNAYGKITHKSDISGVETFVGVTYDASFGPLVGFGLGGVAVEVWKDVVDARVRVVKAVPAPSRRGH